MNIYKAVRFALFFIGSTGSVSSSRKQAFGNRRIVISACALLASLLMHSNAQALLISADSSFGADTITYDTDTGLEWLDPVLGLASGGGSYNQVTSQLASGGIYEGFRFATASELQTLFFVSAGITLGTPGADQAIADLIGLVGDTFNDSPYPEFTFYATSAYYDYGIPGQVGLASLEVESFLGEWSDGEAFITLSPDSPDLNGGPFGSWLVRDTSLPESVSEPGVFLLLVAALGVAVRRNRRSA